MYYLIFLLFFNAFLYSAEESNAKRQKVSHVAAASAASAIFSISLKDRLSDIIEVSNNQTIFPTDLSQVIIDYAQPNSFFEIGTLKNISEIFSLAWSPDGNQLASSGRHPDVSIKIWDTSNGKRLNILMGNSDSSNLIYWRKSSEITSISSNFKIIVWDLNTAKSKFFKDLSFCNDAIFFCPISNQLAVINGRDLNIYTLIGDKIISRNFLQHNCNLISVAWSPHASKLAIADKNGSICFMDADTQEDIGIGFGHEESATLIWAKDGSKLISHSPYSIKVWNFETNSVMCEIEPDSIIDCVALSPDSNQIAYACNNVIKIWDIKNNQLLLDELTGFDADVTCIAWSPEGTRIAAGSLDKTIKIWGKTLA